MIFCYNSKTPSRKRDQLCVFTMQRTRLLIVTGKTGITCFTLNSNRSCMMYSIFDLHLEPGFKGNNRPTDWKSCALFIYLFVYLFIYLFIYSFIARKGLHFIPLIRFSSLIIWPTIYNLFSLVSLSSREFFTCKSRFFITCIDSYQLMAW